MSSKISKDWNEYLIKSRVTKLNHLSHLPSYSPQKIDVFSYGKHSSATKMECSAKTMKVHFRPKVSWDVNYFFEIESEQ